MPHVPLPVAYCADAAVTGADAHGRHLATVRLTGGDPYSFTAPCSPGRRKHSDSPASKAPAPRPDLIVNPTGKMPDRYDRRLLVRWLRGIRRRRRAVQSW